MSGRVVRAGRTITVCSGEVVAITGTQEKQVAVMLATIIAVPAAGRATADAAQTEL